MVSTLFSFLFMMQVEKYYFVKKYTFKINANNILSFNRKTLSIA